MPRPRLAPASSQLQSLDRALATLELFTASRTTLNLIEVAERLGTGKSTAHRLLSTLEARGYVAYHPRTREYTLGLAAVRLGYVALAGLDLRRVAMPHLRRLSEQLEEAALLLVVEGDSAVVLDHADYGHPMQLTLQRGLPWPLHAGASNKVLLAHLPPDRIERYLSKRLPAMTGQTTTDPAVLRAQLAEIRAQGHARSVGELTPEVEAFAVPILDGELLLGGLTISGLASRMQRKAEEFDIIGILQETARVIARELGSRA